MEIEDIHRLLYLLISAYITLVIGGTLYQSGAVFLKDVFSSNAAMAVLLNRFLLTGYYLINLGYVTVVMANLPKTESYFELINKLSAELGFLMCALALIHYFNIWWISHFHRKLNSLFNHL